MKRSLIPCLTTPLLPTKKVNMEDEAATSSFGMLPLIILVAIGLVVQAVHRMMHHAVGKLLACISVGITSFCRVWKAMLLLPSPLAREEIRKGSHLAAPSPILLVGAPKCGRKKTKMATVITITISKTMKSSQPAQSLSPATSRLKPSPFSKRSAQEALATQPSLGKQAALSTPPVTALNRLCAFASAKSSEQSDDILSPAPSV